MNCVFSCLFVALLLALDLLTSGSSVLAASDPAYSADVPVNSQSDDDRIIGLRLALGQVLARLSGDASAVNRGDVAKALAQAPNYVQQYQYVRATDTSNNVAPAPLLLNAQFDPIAVDELMRKLHLGAHESETSGVIPDHTGSVRVWISGLHSVADYARAMAALAGSENVITATPQRTHDDGILVVLKLRNGVQRLLENLAAAQILNPLPETKTPIDGVDLQLTFHP